MIDRTVNSVTYGGGEARMAFPIPFPFLDPSHLRVHVRKEDGILVVLTAGTDYCIRETLDEHGELVLLDDPLPPGHALTILRLVPLTQEILFHNQGPNSPRAMEEAADKLTMITQQLSHEVACRLPLPEGMTEQGAAQALRDAGQFPALRREVDGKAPIGHHHAITDIGRLPEALSGMAAAMHGHGIGDIGGLAAVLDRKLNRDDPLPEGLKPARHAGSHAAGGSDPVRPEDLGVMPAPPGDGKPYLAAAGGWIEYVAPGEGGGTGTSDHSQLRNRDAPDQHPQAAIQHLPRDLQALRVELAGKAERDELPGPATAQQDGLLPAADKRKLDAMPENSCVLPSGGGSGDFLAINEIGDAFWQDSARSADALPVMTVSQRGLAKLAPNAGLQVDADGALGLRPDNLLSKQSVDSRFTAMGGRLDTVEESLIPLSGLPARMDALGAMAMVDDAPADGSKYVRKNGSWAASGSEGAIAGEIRLLPFRQDELPAGWHFCNGDRHGLTTAPGKALAALPPGLRQDWGIATADAAISLPNLFSAGHGCFLRPVDNLTRFPGSVQEDAIRNITGSFKTAGDVGLAWITSAAGKSVATGAFGTPPAGDCAFSFTTVTHGANSVGAIQFDASKAVPTATENRPVNIGMTPAIYLGV